MATTVTLTKEQEEFLDDQIKSGKFSSRSEILRQAINKYIEEREINDILEARADIKKGKYFSGDLKTILKDLK